MLFCSGLAMDAIISGRVSIKVMSRKGRREARKADKRNQVRHMK